MKIVIATDVYFPIIGGIQVVIKRLSQELSKKGHEVFIIAPSPTSRTYKELEGKVTVYRIGSITLRKFTTFRIPRHLDAVKKIITDINPDIIHIMTPGSVADTAIHIAKKNKIPLIGTGHVIAENILILFHLPKYIETMAGFLIMKQIIHTYQRLDLLTVPSPAAGKLYKKYGLKIPIHVISNGLYLQDFGKVTEKDREKMMKKYNLSDKPIVIYVGRLDKEKRVDVLVKAVGLLKDEDFQLIIAGKGAEKEKIHRLVKKLGIKDKVVFLGYLPDGELPILYSLATAYVMPSDAELQSISTMEAMASGLPVIGANAIALPNLIKNGVNGFLFKPRNSEDLSKKLRTVLNDKDMRKRMAKESLQLIKEHDMPNVIAKMEQTYETIISKYPPRHRE
ncbi:MAG TPA: glycosyltransferase [Candidatus Saccharimonadales bacterium]|nr:glycosyltransferase [Candidatus Saccharimonadales bacterium]